MSSFVFFLCYVLCLALNLFKFYFSFGGVSGESNGVVVQGSAPIYGDAVATPP